jgi:hypothetical protein
VTNVQSKPNKTGPNPNINTLINFGVDLPVDDLYCPRLACDVKDYIFKGFSQPLLGTFSVEIADIKKDTKEKRKN